MQSHSEYFSLLPAGKVELQVFDRLSWMSQIFFTSLKSRPRSSVLDIRLSWRSSECSCQFKNLGIYFDSGAKFKNRHCQRFLGFFQPRMRGKDILPSQNTVVKDTHWNYTASRQLFVRQQLFIYHLQFDQEQPDLSESSLGIATLMQTIPAHKNQINIRFALTNTIAKSFIY